MAKVEAIIKAFDSLDTIVMAKFQDASYFITKVDTAEIENDPENEVLCISYIDEDGDQYGTHFTEENLENATISPSGAMVVMEDFEGDGWMFTVYKKELYKISY